MFIFRSHLVLLSLLFAGSTARASGTAFTPLSVMIAKAERVAVVTITEMEPIAYKERLRELIWRPNYLITVRVDDLVRGSLPKTFQIKTEVSRNFNPSAAINEKAIVFVAAEKSTDDFLYVFSHASGFRVIRDLVDSDDEKCCNAAAAAVVRAVRSMKPQKAEQYTKPVWLDYEAASALLDCAKSPDPRLRCWLFDHALYQVKFTPRIEELIIEALSDPDLSVSSVAARLVVQRRIPFSHDALNRFRAKLPTNEKDLHEEINSYLESDRSLEP